MHLISKNSLNFHNHCMSAISSCMEYINYSCDSTRKLKSVISIEEEPENIAKKKKSTSEQVNEEREPKKFRGRKKGSLNKKALERLAAEQKKKGLTNKSKPLKVKSNIFLINESNSILWVNNFLNLIKNYFPMGKSEVTKKNIRE